MMGSLSRLCVVLLGLGAVVVPVAPVVAGPNSVLPVPAITIYPGETIKDSYLVDHDFAKDDQLFRAGVIDTRGMLIGKVARRTLLPGAPIPLDAVSEPDAVKNGEKVRVVFSQGGLVIETYAMALQAGTIGQVISVRNLDSGMTISGIVQSDGSVRVGG